MSFVLRAGTIFAIVLSWVNFSNAQIGKETTTYLRVDISMDYHWKMPRGFASVKWTNLQDAAGLDFDQTKIALAAFVYARTIVSHSETRRSLIERTQPAAEALARGADSFISEEWRLETGGLSFPIFPWNFGGTLNEQRTKTYTAYLLERDDGLVGGHIEMAAGYERILTPAAPMIPFSILAKELEKPNRVLLGRAIIGINQVYSRMDLSNTAELIGTDALIVTDVFRFLRDENSFAKGGEYESNFSKSDLLNVSHELARNMGTLFARQRACSLQSNVSPDRAAGFFINYMSEAEVQSVMGSYADAIREEARGCDRPALGKALQVIMPKVRDYMRTARPFMKKW